jgi:hypothetical protein
MLLPDAKRKAIRLSPRIMVLYGLPKVGKTKALSMLEDCLIADLEEGTLAHEALAVNVGSMTELKALGLALATHKKETGVNKYKRIAIDTTDILEDWCEVEAAINYKKTAIGKSFTGTIITELPNGAGWKHQREEVKKWIQAFSQLCDSLICVTHVKDKLISTKAGNEVSVKDINLTGKLASIVCSMADAIAYVYREDGKLMVSFDGGDNITAGCRQEHLGGKVMELDWNKIYID